MFEANVLFVLVLLRVEIPLVDPTVVERVSAPVLAKPVSDTVKV